MAEGEEHEWRVVVSRTFATEEEARDWAAEHAAESPPLVVGPGTGVSFNALFAALGEGPEERRPPGGTG
jgi:hypothetical protein